MNNGTKHSYSDDFSRKNNRNSHGYEWSMTVQSISRVKKMDKIEV